MYKFFSIENNFTASFNSILINIVTNIWTINIIYKFINQIKKISKEEINSIINSSNYKHDCSSKFIFLLFLDDIFICLSCIN